MWRPTCFDLGMDEETERTLAALVAELTTIERLDKEYWQSGPRDINESVAHASRRERRSEILRRLVEIAGTLNK